MDWLLTQPGTIRAETRPFADGKEHTFHFKARSPNEIAAHFGAVQSVTKDGQTPETAIAAQKELAKFIAESLCNEDGTPLLSVAQAENIAPILKGELRAIIVDGSSKTVSELGNG
jgi:hypothetical protein